MTPCVVSLRGTTAGVGSMIWTSGSRSEPGSGTESLELNLDLDLDLDLDVDLDLDLWI